MKIAQITPYFLPHNGGMEMYVYNLSRSLIDDGHTVEVITANVPEGRPFEVMDGIYVRRLRCIGEPLRNPLVPSIFLLLKNLKKFDVIHIHNLYSFTALTLPLLKWFCKVPIVLTHHGQLMFGEPMKDMCVRLYEKSAKGVVLGSVDKTVALSESDAQHVTHRGDAPADRHASAARGSVVAIPNGYDGRKFRPMDAGRCREELSLSPDKKVLLNVGRLYGAVKGHKYLIEAISTVVEERGDVLCVIVGAGRLHKTLEDQIHALGLEDYVMLAGGRPHDEIPTWLNACDLFVLPSLSEGNPTVMFEAFGCGKPFVGTSVGGVPEIVTSEEYGLLVDPGDSGGLTRAILEALERDWDERAIRAFSERYTWENVSREIVKVYGQVRGASS